MISKSGNSCESVDGSEQGIDLQPPVLEPWHGEFGFVVGRAMEEQVVAQWPTRTLKLSFVIVMPAGAWMTFRNKPPGLVAAGGQQPVESAGHLRELGSIFIGTVADNAFKERGALYEGSRPLLPDG